MRVGLLPLQRPEHRDQGKLTGPDGRGYARQSTKTDRRKCDELVQAGVPLVLDLYGHGQFEWADASDAVQIWHEVRPYVITTEPTSKQLAKHEMWTAGVWASDDDRRVLYLLGRC